MMISTLMEYDVCLLHGTFPSIIKLHVQYYIDESLCAIEHIYGNDVYGAVHVFVIPKKMHRLTVV